MTDITQFSPNIILWLSQKTCQVRDGFISFSKPSKMHDFCQFLSLASLALQVSRDCETNFKSRLARDARPLKNPRPLCYPFFKFLVHCEEKDGGLGSNVYGSLSGCLEEILCAIEQKSALRTWQKPPIDCQERRAIVLPQPPIELRQPQQPGKRLTLGLVI